MTAFVDWYLTLGFSRIFIIQNDDHELVSYPSESVNVVRDYGSLSDDGKELHPDKLVSKYWESLHCEWLFVCDTDEFLLLDQNKYQNISDFVDKKETIYGSGLIDVFQFRWANLENMNPSCYNKSVMSLIKDHSPNLYWDAYVKSMVI